MKKGNPIALLPIGVFLILYLGLGLVFEYGMKIPMGFYNVPIVAAFLVAVCTACVQNRKVSFEEKLAIMGQGVGDKNIITMLLIFLAAGAFVGVVGRSSAQSVAYFMLSVIPAQFAVAVLFVVSCFISTAMGTSVGTITLLTPIAVEVAAAAGYSPALCIATIVGGSMFGDNLSVISDTTIAACNGQDCAMKDKFRGNFRIALPAAVLTVTFSRPFRWPFTVTSPVWAVCTFTSFAAWASPFRVTLPFTVWAVTLPAVLVMSPVTATRPVFACTSRSSLWPRVITQTKSFSVISR